MVLLTAAGDKAGIGRGAITDGMFLVKTVETAFQFLHKIEFLLGRERFVLRALPEWVVVATSWTGLGTGVGREGIHC